ncbi:hypothetical protein JCM8115_006054 [Rhodotorula mucilaginosa]
MQRSIATRGKRTFTQPRTALASFSSLASSSSSSSSSSAHIAARPIPRQRRAPYKCFSTSRVTRTDEPHSYTISQLTDREYHDVADKTMDRLTEYLEETIEAIDSDQAAAYDVEYSASMCGKSGVLTVRLGDHGTYVLNKQPPNKQIWLSSPKSGPKRYDWDKQHHVWFYHRDGDLLHDLLNRELRQALGDDSIEVDLAERDDD